MVNAAPFAALRYDPAVAGDPGSTSAPAYDDLERFTYAQHRTASPYTVLELLTGEDVSGADAYRAAAGTFNRWVRTHVLVTDPEPAFYLYEIHELRHGVPSLLRGVLAAVAVEGDTLLPHEAVDPLRVESRVRRVEAVPAELAPVFAVHTPGPPALRSVLDAPPTSRPVIAFTDETGSDHRVWALRDPQTMERVQSGLAEVSAVIADGHHRFAAAAQRPRSMPGTDRTLTYLVDSTAYGPQLHPVHRLVARFTATAAHDLRALFTWQPIAAEDLPQALAQAGAPAYGLVIDGADAALLTVRDEAAVRAALPPDRSPTWSRLESAIWNHAVRPLLGDVEIRYRSDVPAAARELHGTGGALFVLRPPKLDDIFACALAGEAMPVKSTWFRPKPRAGLVMRSLH